MEDESLFQFSIIRDGGGSTERDEARIRINATRVSSDSFLLIYRHGRCYFNGVQHGRFRLF